MHYERATKYVGLVGKAQKTTRPGRGKLHNLSVKTTIYYQDTDGAKNYHECESFDAALSSIIAQRFDELAEGALQYLHREALKVQASKIEQLERELAKARAAKRELDQ